MTNNLKSIITDMSDIGDAWTDDLGWPLFDGVGISFEMPHDAIFVLTQKVTRGERSNTSNWILINKRRIQNDKFYMDVWQKIEPHITAGNPEEVYQEYKDLVYKYTGISLVPYIVLPKPED